MFCSNCGLALTDGQTVCPRCGKQVDSIPNSNEQTQNDSAYNQSYGDQNSYGQSYNQPYNQPYNQQYNQPNYPYQNRYVQPDAPSIGYAVLGFFFPLVGLILYLIWKDETPLRAKSAGKGALISVIVSVVMGVIVTIFTIIFGTIGLSEFYGMEEFYY